MSSNPSLLQSLNPVSHVLTVNINQNLYYQWSKDFLEAGKRQLAGDTARQATSDEVKALHAQARQLKELLAELLLEKPPAQTKCPWRWGGESDT